MNKASELLLTASLSLLAPTISNAENQPQFDNKLKEEQHKNWLAVLNANEGVLTQKKANHYTLTLHHFNTNTILFTDRPDRETQSITTQAFIRQFNEIFADSRPNAALTYDKVQHDNSSKNQSVIVTLTNAKLLNETSIEFTFTLEENSNSPKLGTVKEVHIFIDDIRAWGAYEHRDELKV